MTAAPSAQSGDRQGGARAAGAALIVCGLLATGLMVAHPSISAGTLSAAFAEAAHEAPIAKFVHGTFIAVIAVWAFGYVGFAGHIGLRRPLVLAGVIGFVLAAGAGVGAAVINGLVFPEFAARYADRSLADMQLAHTVMAFGSQVSGVLAQICVLAWSLAAALWSLVVVRLSGAWRWLGGFGILIGIAIPAALLGGHLTLDVHGFGVFVLGQSLWSAGVGIKLIRQTS